MKRRNVVALLLAISLTISIVGCESKTQNTDSVAEVEDTTIKLSDYGIDEDSPAYEIAEQMKEIIDTYDSSDLYYYEDAGVAYVCKLLEDSKKYDELLKLRLELCNLLYSDALNLYMDDNVRLYENVVILLSSISNFRDVPIKDSINNELVLNMFNNLAAEHNYEALYTKLNDIVEKSVEVEKLSKLYSSVYEEYSNFLGEFNKFEISIAYLPNDEESRVRLIIKDGGVELTPENPDDQENYVYKNLKVSKNELSFDYNENGILDPIFEHVSIVLSEDNYSMTVNGESMSVEKPTGIQLMTRDSDMPEIGDSKEMVEATSWGNPIRVNTTTTAYGTSEQWVYSNNCYIYLDNDIVTAIQDFR